MSDAGGPPRALPPVPLEPLRERDPRSLGPFRLLGRLGAGGMGVAFLSEAGGDWSVVKVVRTEFAEDRSHRARIARELEAMRRTSGPYTAALLEEHLDDDPAWFAMEFIPGMTLTRRIQEAGALPPTQVRSLAEGLAHVLESIHSAGVTHRDLKPSNVMLSPTGPRLIDFGIADLTDATQLTRTGSVVGSTGWLAPEQITGAEVTAATDVHAWGLCVLYAATGRAPFDSGTASTSLYRVLEETPEVPESMGEPLRTQVVSALNKDPSRRPTVAQLLATLAPPAAPPPPPPLPPPPSTPSPATREVAPTDQWTEAAPLAAVGAAGTTSPVAAPPAPPTPTGDGRRGGGAGRWIAVAIVMALLVIAGGVALLVWGSANNDTAADTPRSSAPAGPSIAASTAPPEDGSPQPSSSAPPAQSSDATAAPALTYSIWVDHEDPIPDQIVKNSLDWQVDLCSPDKQVATPGIRNKIALFHKENGEWVRQPAKASAEIGDRCGKNRVHIVLDASEPAPPESELGKGWGSCTDYRVVVPETKDYAKTYVDMCVRTRVDEEG